MSRLVDRWLPQPHIRHSWPEQRFDARTQGRSLVRNPHARICAGGSPRRCRHTSPPNQRAVPTATDYFSSLDHSWLVKFLEHRIADKRVLRLIQTMVEGGGHRRRGLGGDVGGNAAGGVDLDAALRTCFFITSLTSGFTNGGRRHARGDVVVVRFADDFVVGFQRRDDAERFWAELRERFARFGLELHEGKTRLIEFGRYRRRDTREPRAP